jgi:thioredoxin-related protein
MKTMMYSFLTLSWLAVSGMVAQPSDSIKQIVRQHTKFDPVRDAQKDIQDAMTEAKKFNKRILLDVGGEWCVWCHRLDSLFVQNKVLDDYLNEHYVVVKINVSKENKNEKVLSKYPKVAGYPHIFILNKYGKFVHSQDTGELEFPKGHPVKGHNPKKVIAFLKKWAK